MYGSYTSGAPGVQPMGYTNPYQNRLEALQMQQMQPQQMQRFDIIHVNGENGAKSFRMAPNSQCLLLDDTAPIVWLCQSDGAGYHTVAPYTITPYQAEQKPDISSFDDRLKRLEEKIYGKPDATSPAAAKRTGSQSDGAE